MLLRRAGALLCVVQPQSGRRGVPSCSLHMEPIGHIQTIFTTRFGTPRQGCLAPAARARLPLDGSAMGSLSAVQTVEGIEEYSHLWLLWGFHKNDHAASNPKVRPPRLRGERTGLFATRSPYRPNPIGLSLVKLEGVENTTLLLSGADLLDGTPVYDVKPFVPYCDSPYDASIRGDEQGDVYGAAWVSDERALRVTISPEATAQLAEMLPHLPARGNFGSVSELRDAITQCLQADPRPLYRWRRQKQAAGADEYSLVLGGVSIRCRFEADDASVTVLSLGNGGSSDGQDLD